MKGISIDVVSRRRFHNLFTVTEEGRRGGLVGRIKNSGPRGRGRSGVARWRRSSRTLAGGVARLRRLKSKKWTSRGGAGTSQSRRRGRTQRRRRSRSEGHWRIAERKGSELTKVVIENVFLDVADNTIARVIDAGVVGVDDVVSVAAVAATRTNGSGFGLIEGEGRFEVRLQRGMANAFHGVWRIVLLNTEL